MINKHNNSIWYELLAKCTLEIVFPQEFNNLKSSDKPDLIDDSRRMGIEVIHPIDERHMQLEAYYQKFLSGKKLSEIPEMGLEKFRENLYDVMISQDDGIIHAYRKPYEAFDIELLYRAIDKKYEKLNKKHYLHVNHVSLYLEMAMCSLESMEQSVAEKILCYAKRLQEQYQISYREIFYDSLMVLYRIDLTTEKITRHDISQMSESIMQKFDNTVGINF